MFWFDFNWQIQNLLLQFWWPINLLLLVVAGLILFLAYKKTTYALGLIIILLPTYLFRSNIGFLPFTYLELIFWLTFLGWLTSLIKQKRKPEISLTYLWPMILIFIASLIGLLIAPGLKTAAGLWKAYFFEPILFFFIAYDSIKDKKDKNVILWALGISGLFISLLAIYQKFTGFAIVEPGWTAVTNRRVTSIFTSPNAVGLFLAPITTIYIGWLISGFKKILPSIIKTIIIILNLLAIIFTVSQGTCLGLAAAIIFLIFFGWSKKWTSTIIILLILIALLTPLSRNKIMPVLTLQDQSGQNRLLLWQSGYNYLINSPTNFVLGAGIFGFQKIFNQTRDPLKIEALLYPHNIILNFWLEIGLVGLIGFIWLIIYFFKIGTIKISQEKWLTLGIMAAMVTIVVHGLIDVPYFKNDLAILFWLIISLL
ncbi:MAG: O-antigen ligase family protein [Candidatus Buchananbacteria bacterium]|nr:O-antigen ligase family protein [Candidatus Buchananbacteria bacterium]